LPKRALIPAVILKAFVFGGVVPLETFLEVDDPLMILAMGAYLLYANSRHADAIRS
jgi:lipid-A-disaccharide synthase-like uncharacterized protein